VDEFLQARSLSPNSQKAYRRELERFLEWTDKAWSDITPRQIAQFKADLLEERLKAAILILVKGYATPGKAAIVVTSE
jgi:integrase/recombinase XerD